MTEYRRYQGRSYMVINSDADGKGYEYPMITENRIAGLLPCRIMNENEKLQFWYEISGMQTLKDWMEIKKPGSGLLKKLIMALADAIERSGEYLLCENGISLDPDRIFIDAKAEEISFCYMPFQKTELEEAMQSFTEYYISHMGHGDRENAKICYDIYEKCQQGYTAPKELLQELFHENDVQEFPALEETKESLSENLKQKSYEKKEISEILPVQKLQMHLWKEKIRNRKILPFPKKKVSQEAFAFEPEEYPEEDANITVFLGSEKAEISGELKYEGDGNRANIKITEPVFVIGSQREGIGGVISSDTVSRIHARITKEGEDYYLEDMNSTNGTYCNGTQLNYKEKRKLEKNDRIVFAKERYRFV